jgi:uncharacterized membrane protein
MMWGSGWWIVGALFMVFCFVMMFRMMSHGGAGHGGAEHGDHGDGADAERTLANRLARGEIDVEEYERLLETLRRTESTPRT